VAFGVVAELGSYPDFIDSCNSVCLTAESGEALAATLSMSGAGLSGDVPITLELSRPSKILMRFDTEFFSHLEATWSLAAIDDQRSEIRLEVDYDFPGRMQAMMFGKASEHMLRRLIDGVAAEASRRHA